MIRTIVIAGCGFVFVSALGVLRALLPVLAIDRLRVRILCRVVNLGAGVDDVAIERLRRIPSAERILEEMIDERGSQNYQITQRRDCSSPAMVLEMMRSQA